jgi:hypothetical protein
MPFRFQKRIRLAKGVTLNIGKRGVSSLRVGRRGAGVSMGKRGTRTSVSVPGTGASYSKTTAGCLLPIGMVAIVLVLAWH